MSTRSRITDSILVGLFVAGFYSVWITVIRLAKGVVFFEQLGIPYPILLLYYLGAAVISGTVVGLLMPIGRTLLGAYCLGVIAAWPVYLGAIGLLYAEPGWFLPGAVAALGLALLSGGPIGLYVRYSA